MAGAANILMQSMEKTVQIAKGFRSLLAGVAHRSRGAHEQEPLNKVMLGSAGCMCHDPQKTASEASEPVPQPYP